MRTFYIIYSLVKYCLNANRNAFLTLFAILFVTFVHSSVICQEINPWDLSIQERILTRKNISHIVLDPRKEEYRVSLITSERYPYNFKSVSFPLFFRLETEEQAMRMMRKLDAYLETGEAITVQLKGSEIKGVIFHEPYEQLP
ncbi:hypothetical protein [Leptospira sp. GIMC2001]|uniref:hypothetical protein n=1 Tax=Leptospira sp. GIMC2001 TaxID=1513297 RepID=UPI00234B0006|nr:hypothetical protein [Leptospira sp. GIMC2001]WCL50264.1 hypothetical protein O4O04_05430 [Leptospira sp. GIMC2001]